ncbi:MAG: type II toxin-antitoxin system RelE/ParE family toxin [Chitinophagales bacterium]
MGLYKALEDIDEIAENISHYSSKYASQIVEEFFSKEPLLANFPRMGRVVPEMKNRDIRELIHKNYRIIYYIIDATHIDILTIHHSSRPLDVDGS